MFVCLERGANDLHVDKPMSMPPHHLMLQYNPEWFCLSGARLSQVVLEKIPLNGTTTDYYYYYYYLLNTALDC